MHDDAPDPGDETMARINAGIMALHGGDREGARARFEALWAELGEDGDPFHRCTLAHYMADAQDDPHAELRWDLRALAAADALDDARVKAYHASLALRAFYPSLHLNAGEAHRKVGDHAAARRHALAAQDALAALPDDGYGQLIRGGVERLLRRLDDPAGA